MTLSPVTVALGGGPTFGPEPVERSTPEPPAPDAKRIEDGLLDDASPGEPLPVIVHFQGDSAFENARSVDGIETRYVFESIPSVYGVAPPSVIRTLGDREDVRFVEDAHKPIEFLLDTATVASRAREVWDPTFTPQEGQVDTNASPSPNLTERVGERVDGSGVGIAVVDTGLDGTHPAFEAAGKVNGNYQVTRAGVVEGGPYTDRASGHGTAVAGVAAGTGAGSPEGTFKGAAPGATLYSFAAIAGTGADRTIQEPEPTGLTVSPAIAFDWILQNGDDVFPEIDVVSNSWYCAAIPCQTFNPEMAHIRLASQLAENGTVVTWAAGDFAGSTIDSELVPEARNPTPGVIGVASYDDRQLGVRSSCVADFSAHGNPSKPTTWPDVAAPGTQITTTAATVRLDTVNPPVAESYAPRTGTSMAAPHAAGIAALVLQANPSLTPAEVERVLENSAFELSTEQCYDEGIENLPGDLESMYIPADPKNPTDPANWKVGHGLVDAQKAVETALVFEGIPENEPEPMSVPDGFEDRNPGFEVEERFYLAADGNLVTDRPQASSPQRSIQQPGEEAVFTSEALDEPLTTDGFDVAVWIGTLNENLFSPVGPFDGGEGFEFTLERVGPGGQVLERAIANTDYWYRHTAKPVERDAFEHFDDREEPITFQPGEKIRLKIDVRDPLGSKPTGDVLPWVLSWGGTDTPSHVGLGPSQEHMPVGSYEFCRAVGPRLCGWLDANHTEPFYRCEARGTYRLVWYGPPGSRAVLNCQQATAICEIPEGADEWQRCESTTIKVRGSARQGRAVKCTYDVPAGTPPLYEGRCVTVNSP